jgi:hypothetical protein
MTPTDDELIERALFRYSMYLHDAAGAWAQKATVSPNGRRPSKDELEQLFRERDAVDALRKRMMTLPQPK